MGDMAGNDDDIGRAGRHGVLIAGLEPTVRSDGQMMVRPAVR
jgi:hypothetical protein